MLWTARHSGLRNWRLNLRLVRRLPLAGCFSYGYGRISVLDGEKEFASVGEQGRISWGDAVAFCQALSQKDGKPYRLPRRHPPRRRQHPPRRRLDAGSRPLACIPKSADTGRTLLTVRPALQGIASNSGNRSGSLGGVSPLLSTQKRVPCFRGLLSASSHRRSRRESMRLPRANAPRSHCKLKTYGNRLKKRYHWL